MDIKALLEERIEDKFIRYCLVDTTSVVGKDKTPSSEGQWTLARMSMMVKE